MHLEILRNAAFEHDLDTTTIRSSGHVVVEGLGRVPNPTTTLKLLSGGGYRQAVEGVNPVAFFANVQNLM